MNIAFTTQKFQDWFTQQWVILWGRKIEPAAFPWLLGPFGELNGIGEDFIYQLAEKEGLVVQRNSVDSGLLGSINELGLADQELNRLSKKVIDFYEHTANYNLAFRVKWNPFFRLFGFLVNRLFSQRINQLNVPTSGAEAGDTLSSEILQLVSRQNNEVKYTIWLRKFASTGKVVYSGIYGTCLLPSGVTCIKAVFPLPKGNATVIMRPAVGENGELILNAAGKQFNDAGFYFLVNDANGNNWAQYIASFTDRLVIVENGAVLQARQRLGLWGLNVANFEYFITE